MGTTEALHDAQDATEDLVAEARKVTEDTVKGTMGAALDVLQQQPVSDVFAYLASLVEESQAPVTTKGVRVGYEAMRKLRKSDG